MIEELPLLPVQFDRNMAAAVQKCMDLPAIAHRESRLRYPRSIDRETQAMTAVDQRVAVADQAPVQACCRSHAASSATLAAQ